MKWKQTYPSHLFQNPWSDMNKYVIPNKVKETHFKIIHRCYPCNEFISKFKEGFSPLCCFCKKETESIFHLFFSCNYTKLFWSQISLFIFELFYTFIYINDIMVLFLDCDTGLVEMDNIIKILILFGKYHIHKAKCMLNVANGKLFSIDLRIFYESLTSIQINRKAIKTSQLLKRIIDVID